MLDISARLYTISKLTTTPVLKQYLCCDIACIIFQIPTRFKEFFFAVYMMIVRFTFCYRNSSEAALTINLCLGWQKQAVIKNHDPLCPLLGTQYYAVSVTSHHNDVSLIVWAWHTQTSWVGILTPCSHNLISTMLHDTVTIYLSSSQWG